MPVDPPPDASTVAVVIPVYAAAGRLCALVDEIAQQALAWNDLHLQEVICVFDAGDQATRAELERLAQDQPLVRVHWLRANVGQHRATYLGLRSASADWVVTLDEDGEHAPADIAPLVRHARDGGRTLVYGFADQRRGLVKASDVGLWALRKFGVHRLPRVASFRVIDGGAARTLAYSSPWFLDVALVSEHRPSWVTVDFVDRADRPSSYRMVARLDHALTLAAASNGGFGALRRRLAFIVATALAVATTARTADARSRRGVAALCALMVLAGGLAAGLVLRTRAVERVEARRDRVMGVEIGS